MASSAARPIPLEPSPSSPGSGRAALHRSFLPEEPWLDMLLDKLCAEASPGILTFEMDELMQRVEAER